jgi:hypothetical protein
MLEAILNHLHNWFLIPGAARCGTFEVASGTLEVDFLQYDQYYRIEGSVFNDGLHQNPGADMKDEVFNGTVYPMAVPVAVINLCEKIEKWCEDNPESDKISESFGGYSYSRGTDGNGTVSGGWQMAFRKELNVWKKVG